MWVQSLASHNGLRTRHFSKLWHMLQMQLGSSVVLAVAKASVAAPMWSLAQEFPYATGVAIKRKEKKKEITSWYTDISLKRLCYSLENNNNNKSRKKDSHSSEDIYVCVCVFVWAYISALHLCEVKFIAIMWAKESKVQSRVPFSGASCPCAPLIPLLVTEQGGRQLGVVTDTCRWQASVFQRGLKRSEETDLFCWWLSQVS